MTARRQTMLSPPARYRSKETITARLLMYRCARSIGLLEAVRASPRSARLATNRPLIDGPQTANLRVERGSRPADVEARRQAGRERDQATVTAAERER